jgi:hypothetical protein
MFGRIAASAILAFALGQGEAFAQAQTGSPSQKPEAGPPAQTLPQRIQHKLKSQGFTNIQVVPEGYIVSARDKDGDPVTMIIGPHSITMFAVSSAAGPTEHRSTSEREHMRDREQRPTQNR